MKGPQSTQNRTEASRAKSQAQGQGGQTMTQREPEEEPEEEEEEAEPGWRPFALPLDDVEEAPVGEETGGDEEDIASVNYGDSPPKEKSLGQESENRFQQT